MTEIMQETDCDAVDMFCGGGGTSTALVRVMKKRGYNWRLWAINHDPVAIATHKANHPKAIHLQEEMDNLDPRKVVPGGRLKIAVASAECRYHSNAAGGAPINDQSRATAWHILRWAEALYIDNILIENVPEFRQWGPLDKNGKRIKSKKGEIYLSFIDQLRSLGYIVEDRVVCCADYGDATTRRRLFIMCRKEKPIQWPEPSYAAPALVRDLFGERKPWRAAREILDLEDKGKLLSQRKRQLAANTMRRIIRGFFKTNGLPFVLGQQSQAAARSVDSPLPTIATAGGQHLGLATPFLTVYHGEKKDEVRTASIDEPMPTIDTSNRYGLVQPYIVATNHGNDDSRTYSIEKPFPTITTVDAWSLVSPYVVKYYGTGGATKIDEPLDTITTKDRFGLVTPLMLQDEEGTVFLVDFYFRMLKPSELAAATSFPRDYKFEGNRGKQVWQIGNAVPGLTAEALISELI